ncbi:LysR family transcriptional regulator [Saccharopolyspora taberi]|uniref:LysR family transcriptional regulator n=1 Tax=Saccharopolyspora taberi TaxID=60895 RepID=A0ABN3VJV2_9PSEU
MLDVRRMQVLRAVVTSGSVSAAAAGLGYTPSAISQQLSTLEREAGLPLLEKAGRGVRPTPAGILLADRAAQLAELLGDTEAELADLRSGRTGVLRLHFFHTASVTLVPPAVAKFRARHPEVRLELNLTDTGLDVVEAGDTDLAVIVAGRKTPAVRGVRLISLADDPYFVVLPNGHPRSTEDGIDLAELSDEIWVNSDRDSTGPCAEPLADAFACAGFTPRVAVTTDGSYSAQGFVAAGLGIALLPGLGLDVVHPDVVAVPLRGAKPARRIHVAVREAVLEQPATQAMLTALKDVASAPATGRC